MAVTVPGEAEPAEERLLAQLDARAASGDAVCALAARALRQRDAGPSFAPEAMAAAVDRLVHLVREQDAQIRALRALIDAQL